MARIQAGRVELWRSSVDLREVVTRSVRAVEPLLQSNRQQLQVSVPDEPVVASVDVERVARVLRNLLGNANKYGREGGSIGVSLDQTPEEACLSVTDDGPGIAPDQQERIFERFYRVGGAASSGTGLGLAIARGLVDLHGGRLWVESTPGQGSTFRVTLPRI